jgi:hypothetical protein
MDCIDTVALIGKVLFSHVFRETNRVAHVLARESFLNKNSCNWVDEPPGFVLDDLLNDVICVEVKARSRVVLLPSNKGG